MTLPVDATFWLYLNKTLRTLRLDDKQRADFITYWMADISRHQYLAFRFLTQDEINFAAELQIDPVPELVYRVFSIFGKGKKEDVLRSSKSGEARMMGDALERDQEKQATDSVIAEDGGVGLDTSKKAEAKQSVETDWAKVVTGEMDMMGWKKDKFSVLEWGGMIIQKAEDAGGSSAEAAEAQLMASGAFGTIPEEEA